jgi:hypothetical protein
MTSLDGFVAGPDDSMDWAFAYLSAKRRGLPAASDANHDPTSARREHDRDNHERLAARARNVRRGPANEPMSLGVQQACS